MEQKFNNKRLDLQILREFCEREGEEIAYRKGDQLEREGDPARWFAFVTEGCFKYVKYGMSDDKAHITWFSFQGEFVCDYPTFLYGRPSQATIEAMVPSRVRRVTGQQLELFFDQNMETMKLRAMLASTFSVNSVRAILTSIVQRPVNVYEMLLQRCPAIMDFLDLQDIASFLNVHPNTVSKIRREITFGDR